MSKNNKMCDLVNCRGCLYQTKEKATFFDKNMLYSILMGAVIAVALYAYLIAVL